jgi:hypothetical protein
MDGCDNTRDELENFCGHDHNDFLHWVGAPDGPGTWKFDGLVSVFKTFEGDYDADAVGTWTRVAP